MQRKDAQSNPYRPPEVGERTETQQGISSLRYAANMSCGLAALIVMVPVTAIAIYSMSASQLPGVLVAILLILGAGHSVWWAHRARKKSGKQGS
jgi:hypothetical protein